MTVSDQRSTTKHNKNYQ